MSSDNLLETFFECRNAELSPKAKSNWDVIKRTIRLVLVQEPESLLCKRQWQIPIASRALDRRRRSALSRQPLFLNSQRKVCEHRILKDTPQRQLDLKDFTYS